jgi:hypothetical protein
MAGQIGKHKAQGSADLHVGNHLVAAVATTKDMSRRPGHSTMNTALAYQSATDQRAAEIANE